MLQYNNSLKDKGNVATNITTIPTKDNGSIIHRHSKTASQSSRQWILITMAEYNILQDNVSVPSITITARTQHRLKQWKHCIASFNIAERHCSLQDNDSVVSIKMVDRHCSLQDNGSIASITMVEHHCSLQDNDSVASIKMVERHCSVQDNASVAFIIMADHHCSLQGNNSINTSIGTAEPPPTSTTQK